MQIDYDTIDSIKSILNSKIRWQYTLRLMHFSPQKIQAKDRTDEEENVHKPAGLIVPNYDFNKIGSQLDSPFPKS